MSNNKQSSVEWLQKAIYDKLHMKSYKTYEEIIDEAKAMHKDEVKIIIEHYHNNMFYLKLTDKELKNITEIIYDKIFKDEEVL